MNTSSTAFPSSETSGNKVERSESSQQPLRAYEAAWPCLYNGTANHMVFLCFDWHLLTSAEMAQRSSNHMRTKFLATKFLAFLTSIGLITMIAGEAYARISHPIPEHMSGYHHGRPMTSSSSVQEPEASPAPASEHRYTGGPKSND